MTSHVDEPNALDRDNPFDPPNVEYREKLGPDERGEFARYSTKELARFIGDVRTIKIFGGTAVALGASFPICLATDFFLFLAGSDNPEAVCHFAEVVAAVSVGPFLMLVGLVILRRCFGSRLFAVLYLFTAIPASYVLLGPLGTLLVVLFFLPFAAAVIGPIVRNERTFGSDRIEKEELRAMQKEFSFRRKNRIV